MKNIVCFLRVLAVAVIYTHTRREKQRFTEVLRIHEQRDKETDTATEIRDLDVERHRNISRGG